MESCNVHSICSNFDYTIRYGSINRLKSEFADIDVVKVIRHPDYNGQTVQNDLALFILGSDLNITANSAAVALQTEAIPAGSNVTLTGFGKTNGWTNALADRLKKATLRTLNETDCTEFIQKLGIPRHPGHLCTQGAGLSACNVSTSSNKNSMVH